MKAEHTNLQVVNSPPTIGEIDMALRLLKSRNAAEPVNKPAESLKSNRKVAAKMLHF